MDKTSGKRKCNVSKIPGGKHSSLLVVRPKCMKCTSRSQQQEFCNSMGHCGFLVLNVDRTCSYISKMHVLCLITKSQFLNLDHLSWIKFYMLFPKCFWKIKLYFNSVLEILSVHAPQKMQQSFKLFHNHYNCGKQYTWRIPSPVLNSCRTGPTAALQTCSYN